MWKIFEDLQGFVEEVAFSEDFSAANPEVSSLLWRVLKPKPEPSDLGWLIPRLFSDTLFTLTCPFEHQNELLWALDERPVLTIIILLFTNFIRLRCITLCIQIYYKCTKRIRKILQSFATWALPEEVPVLDKTLTRKTSGPHPHPYVSHNCSLCEREIGQFQISVEHLYCGTYFHKHCLLDQLKDANGQCQQCQEQLVEKAQVARIGPVTYRLRKLGLEIDRARYTLFSLVLLYTMVAAILQWCGHIPSTAAIFKPVLTAVEELVVASALIYAELRAHEWVAWISAKLGSWGRSLHPLLGLLIFGLLRHQRVYECRLFSMGWRCFLDQPLPLWLKKVISEDGPQQYTFQVTYHTYDMLREADAIRGAETLVPGWLRGIWRKVSAFIIRI